jgi:hypothetical protein
MALFSSAKLSRIEQKTPKKGAKRPSEEMSGTSEVLQVPAVTPPPRKRICSKMSVQVPGSQPSGLKPSPFCSPSPTQPLMSPPASAPRRRVWGKRALKPKQTRGGSKKGVQTPNGHIKDRASLVEEFLEEAEAIKEVADKESSERRAKSTKAAKYEKISNKEFGWGVMRRFCERKKISQASLKRQISDYRKQGWGDVLQVKKTIGKLTKLPNYVRAAKGIPLMGRTENVPQEVEAIVDMVVSQRSVAGEEVTRPFVEECISQAVALFNLEAKKQGLDKTIEISLTESALRMRAQKFMKYWNYKGKLHKVGGLHLEFEHPAMRELRQYILGLAGTSLAYVLERGKREKVIN